MKTLIYTYLSLFFLTSAITKTEGQTINGDFSLQDVVSGSSVKLSDFAGAKGVVVFFTSEHCPYAKLYEDRVIALASELKSLGIHTILVNPNDPGLSPDDSIEKMKAKAREKGYSFPYLADKQQEGAKLLQAQKTPEAILLKPSGNGFQVVYKGAFDDNPMAATEVKEAYLENAAKALAAGRMPVKKETRPTGCMIKSR